MTDSNRLPIILNNRRQYNNQLVDLKNYNFKTLNDLFEFYNSLLNSCWQINDINFVPQAFNIMIQLFIDFLTNLGDFNPNLYKMNYFKIYIQILICEFDNLLKKTCENRHIENYSYKLDYEKSEHYNLEEFKFKVGKLLNEELGKISNNDVDYINLDIVFKTSRDSVTLEQLHDYLGILVIIQNNLIKYRKNNIMPSYMLQSFFSINYKNCSDNCSNALGNIFALLELDSYKYSKTGDTNSTEYKDDCNRITSMVSPNTMYNRKLSLSDLFILHCEIARLVLKMNNNPNTGKYYYVHAMIKHLMYLNNVYKNIQEEVKIMYPSFPEKNFERLQRYQNEINLLIRSLEEHTNDLFGLKINNFDIDEIKKYLNLTYRNCGITYHSIICIFFVETHIPTFEKERIDYYYNNINHEYESIIFRRKSKEFDIAKHRFWLLQYGEVSEDSSEEYAKQLFNVNQEIEAIERILDLNEI